MIEDLFSMRGQVCVVTGGSSGLGRHMARGFLGAGAARVYITARSKDKLEATAAELAEAADGDCFALPGDLRSMEGIEQLTEDLTAREDHLDVLVNNAGDAKGEWFGKATEEDWDAVVDLNLKTPFFLTQALTPLLTRKATAASASRVIGTSSVAASESHRYVFSYAASKAGLEQLTRALAMELADRHVLVNAIAPGRFFSPMTSHATKDPEAESLKRELAQIPLHRYGEMEDLAGVAIMLCSRAGAYFTGEVLNVDGGHRLAY